MRLTMRLGSLAATAASLALVAGCAGGGSQIPSSTQSVHQPAHAVQTLSIQQRHSNIVTLNGVVPAVQRHVKSHFVAGKPITSAVFVSDYGNNDVNIFNFPAKQLVGTIGGLSNPQGMYTDKSGNLYVANTGASNIETYAAPYNGSPTTLQDPGMYPTDVTMDASGNIFASNIISTSGGAGSEVMYAGGSGNATTLNMSNACYECFFTAVDKSGNVWVDGFNSSFIPTVGYYGPGGSGTFTPISFTPSFPGGIAFDRKGNMILDDQLGDGGFASEAFVFAPGSSSPFAQFPLQNDGSDVVTIALGTVQKRLFTGDANFVNFCSQPILTYPAGSIVNSFLADGGGCSEPIGVAANPATH